MTIQQYRDNLAEEYHDYWIKTPSMPSGAFKKGFNAAAEHIEKLEKALDAVINKVGLTHHEDCDHFDDEDSLCSCGVHKFEMQSREALSSLPWRGGK